MTDDQKTKLARGLRKELTEAQTLERDLDRLFRSLQPPYGAENRLAARLDAIADPAGAFDERDLVLDGGVIEGPYSFEEALARQNAAEDDADQPDLLAAGLEEEPIDEPVQPESDEPCNDQ